MRACRTGWPRGSATRGTGSTPTSPRAPSLAELAAGVGVHPVTLARAFRRTFGCTIGEYLRRLRIERAAEQLATGTQPLAEIALAAGFADQSHFSNVFRRRVGMSPSAYRREVAGSRRRASEPHPLQQPGEADVRAQRIQQRLDLQVGEPAAAVVQCPVEPLERRVGLAEAGVEHGERHRRQVVLPRLGVEAVEDAARVGQPSLGRGDQAESGGGQRGLSELATASRNAAADSSYIPSWR